MHASGAVTAMPASQYPDAYCVAPPENTSFAERGAVKPQACRVSAEACDRVGSIFNVTMSVRLPFVVDRSALSSPKRAQHRATSTSSWSPASATGSVDASDS